MRRRRRTPIGSMIVVALLLAGCGEKDQSLPATVKKTSSPAYHGAHDGFVTSGWKPGDRTSWEEQIRKRGLMQNEYNKTN